MKRVIFAAALLTTCEPAYAQVVVPVQNGTTVVASGSQTVSGLFNGDTDLIYTVSNVTGDGGITFSVCSTDPLNPAGGCLTTATGAQITSATVTPQAVKLHAGHSSSVIVSWSVVANFSGTVWLSVQGVAPSEVQGIDGGMPIAVSFVSSYAAPLPVDPSQQTMGDGGLVLCGTAGTPIPVIAGAKSQLIYNNSALPECLGFVPGLSCPPAIDAGTTIGLPLPPGAYFTENGGVQMYCIVAGTAQTSADAGTMWLDAK